MLEIVTGHKAFQIRSPISAEVDQWHARYMQELEALYNLHAVTVGLTNRLDNASPDASPEETEETFRETDDASNEFGSTRATHVAVSDQKKRSKSVAVTLSLSLSAYANAREHFITRKKRTNGGSGQKRPREAVERASGLVLAFDGAKEDCDREALEAACAAHGKVAFVGFQRGAESGTVRFDDPAHAAAARDALSAAGADAPAGTWRLLEGAEEADYWLSLIHI